MLEVNATNASVNTHRRTPAPSHRRTPAPSHRRTPAPSHRRTVSGVDMLHLAIRLDAPAGRAVEVLARERRRVRHRRPGLTPPGDDLGARGLHVAALVPRAALQDDRSAVPAPRH